MNTYKATIEGIVPILFNRFTEANQKELDVGSTGRQTAEGKNKRALEKVYRNQDGLYCPALCVKKAMTLACSIGSLKYGKKALGPILRAVAFIDPTEIPFGVQEPDYIDVQSGRIPPGPRGARVMINRPALRAGWQLSFNIACFDDRVSGDQIRRALGDAGIYQGLCDGRPDFGRYIIKSFEQIEGGK